MPSPEQEARAFLAAQQQRERMTTAAAPVGAQEAADTAAITEQPASNFVLPGIASTAASMATPYNLVTTAGGALGAAATKTPAGYALGERVAQPVATAAQRAWEGKEPFGEGFVGDTAYNAALNEFSNNVVSPALGKAASWIGQATPVQTIRKGIAKKVLGRVTGDAVAADTFSREMIDDVEQVVNRARAGSGLPLYSRDALEYRLGKMLPYLKGKGVFTVGDLTEGGKIDVAEGVAKSSTAGKGLFASKQNNREALFDEWPKVYAALLGDPAQGPDQMASMASQEIQRALKKKAATAGGIMESVEQQVGSRVVPLDETLLDGLQRQIELYAKTNRGPGGKVAYDPEGVDNPLQSAIGLVEKATGKTWDAKTNTFSGAMPQTISIGGATMPLSQVNPTLLAALNVQPTTNAPTEFTWTNIKTLSSNLSALAKRSADKDNQQASSVLSTLKGALKGKMDEVLDAEDAARGIAAGQPGSMRTTWEMGQGLYKQAMDLRDGFPARGWIEALAQAGSGSKVVSEIWPDDADINRIGQLKDLMGGDGSPSWSTLKRFKIQEMMEKHGSSPDKLVELLTSSTQHSKDYWETVLGKDQYTRFQKFAKTLEFSRRKNPGEARMLGSMVDAGMIMRIARTGGQLGTVGPMAILGGTGNLGAAAGAAAGAGAMAAGWLVTNRQLAKWLTNPNDSKMLQALMNGGKHQLKARTWFRNQAARAIADASKTDSPDIRPIPVSTSRENFRNATGRTPAPVAAYNGIRG